MMYIIRMQRRGFFFFFAYFYNGLKNKCLLKLDLQLPNLSVSKFTMYILIRLEYNL